MKFKRIGLGLFACVGLFVAFITSQHRHAQQSGEVRNGIVAVALSVEDAPLAVQPETNILTPKTHGEAETCTTIQTAPQPLRVYCMIPYLWNKSSITGGYVEGNTRAKYNEIMASYGSRCDVIRFFVDPVNNETEAATLPDNVIEMKSLNRTYGCTLCGPAANLEPCKHIWEKVWRMWVWVAEHESHMAEWFVKLDDDSFLFPENVLYYARVSGLNHNELHYFGNEANHRHTPIILGAAVIFSRELLLRSRPIWEAMPYEDSFQTNTCADVHGSTEELTTAVCLKQLNVKAHGATLQGRETVMVMGPLGHLWSRRGDNWYWARRDVSTQDGPQCCSAHPIAFHHMKRAGSLKEANDPIYANTSARQPQMLLKYYKKVESNLQLLKIKLRVAYDCTCAINFVKRLIGAIFPERQIEFTPLRLEQDSDMFRGFNVVVLSSETTVSTPKLGSELTKVTQPFTIVVSHTPFDRDAEMVGDVIISTTEVAGKSNLTDDQTIFWPRGIQLVAASGVSLQTGSQLETIGQKESETIFWRDLVTNTTAEYDTVPANDGDKMRFSAAVFESCNSDNIDNPPTNVGAATDKTRLMEAVVRSAFAKGLEVDVVLVCKQTGTIEVRRGPKLEVIWKVANRYPTLWPAVFRSYSFVFAMETDLTERVWTETVVNAALGRAIPVVIGIEKDPFLKHHFKYTGFKRVMFCKLELPASVVPDTSPSPSSSFSSSSHNTNVDVVQRLLLQNSTGFESLPLQNSQIQKCLSEMEDMTKDQREAILIEPFVKLGGSLIGTIFDIVSIGKRIRASFVDNSLKTVVRRLCGYP
eukprot:m.41862 g.41862  ORF g.41862 m.41862 type:complete len:812 (+) comp18935_c0_seq1:266-2701(+)